MANWNNVCLAGNLTADPELTYTSNGTAVCNFALAINKKAGEKEYTTFVRCKMFGKGAEVLAKYLTKGKNLLVSGELQEDRWITEAGQKCSRLDVVVKDFQFLGSKSESAPEDF